MREIKINRKLGIIIILAIILIIGLILFGRIYIPQQIEPKSTPIITPTTTIIPISTPTTTIIPISTPMMITPSPITTPMMITPSPITTPILITPSTPKEREELIGAYYNPLINELFLDKFDTGLNQWFGENVTLGKMISTQPEGQGLLTGDHVLMLNSTGLETIANKLIPEGLKSGTLRFESYSRARPENHWYDLDWFSINLGNHRIRWINSYNGTMSDTINGGDIIDGGFTGEWQYNIGTSTNPIWITFGKQELTCNCAHFEGSGPKNHLARKYSPLYLRMDIDLDSNEYVEFQSNDKVWKFNSIKPAEKTILKDIGFGIKAKYTNLTWLALDSVFLSTDSTNMGINKIKFNPIPHSGLFQPLEHIYSYDYFDKGLRGWSQMGISTYEGSYVYNDTYQGIPVLTGVQYPFSKDIWPIKRLSWLFPNNVKWEMMLALEDVYELRLISDTQMGVAQSVLDTTSFKRRFFEWRWNGSNKTWYIVDRGHWLKSTMDYQLIKIGEQDLPQNEFVYISVGYNLSTGNFTTFRSMNKSWNINFYNPNYADNEKWYLENLINFGWLVKFNSPNGKIHVESTVISGN